MPAPLAPAFGGDDLADLSALELARRIREGTLTSRELVDRCLDRIEAHDGQVHAFEQRWRRSARRHARRADRAVKRGEPLGTFHGVPTAVKSHHLVRGSRFSLATRGLPPMWSRRDDPVVQGLRAAGFVLLGKTAMSELGLLPITETPVNPPVRNPWDLSRTAGGSSGGAGAALAAGMVPVAPGSDGAGSVRIPAALNGLLGLKTTRGLVPLENGAFDPFGLTVVGPMGRTVDDVAALLDVICQRRHAHHLPQSREALPKLRIGVVTEPPFGVLHDGHRAQVVAAAEAFRAAGHDVVDVPCPRGTVDEFAPLYQVFLSRIPVLFPQRMDPTVRWFWEEGRRTDPAKAMAVFREFEARGLTATDGLDVMLTPTTPAPPPMVGAYDPLPPAEHFAAAAELGMFTALANVTGQPALTVPMGTVEGVPSGVQLVGHRGRDALLLALARVVLPA